MMKMMMKMMMIIPTCDRITYSLDEVTRVREDDDDRDGGDDDEDDEEDDDYPDLCE